MVQEGNLGLVATGDVRVFHFHIVGAAGSANVFASAQNPWGRAAIVTRAVLNVTTQSTGACTLDIGPAADATTANDTLMDGVSGAAAGLFDNLTDHGTDGLNMAALAAGGYITVKEASGDVTALVADLYIEAVLK